MGEVPSGEEEACLTLHWWAEIKLKFGFLNPLGLHKILCFLLLRVRIKLNFVFLNPFA
jgi:hypothetical protein